VLSATAEKDLNIRNRFITDKKNAAGIYCVTLFINGISTPVIVDDWFPVRYDKPAFCSSN